MKKLFTTLVLAGSMSWMGASAQPMMSYSVGAWQGTYEEITDGSDILSGDSIGEALTETAFWGASVDKAFTELKTVEGLPIGFDLKYGDEVVNRFVIGGDMYVAFGKDNVTLKPSDGYSIPTGTSEGQANAIGMAVRWGTTGSWDTEISYKTTGDVGSRVLIVQYKNVYVDWFGDAIGAVSLQIRAYEGTNKLQLVMDNWEQDINTASLMTKVFLKGAIGDLLCLKGSWSSPEIGTQYSALTYSESDYPVSGQVFEFTPGNTCATPAVLPTDLTLEATSEDLSGSFTASTEGADRYLVLLNKGAAAAEAPVDGVTYAKGDSIGTALVMAYGSETSFESPYNMTLDGSTTYYVSVYAANALCLGGVKYSLLPVVASVKTLPTAPQSLTLSDVDKDKLTVTVTPNAQNDEYILVLADQNWSDAYGQHPTIGTITSDLQTGSVIDGGGKVLYRGNSSAPVVVQDLEANHIYYVQAWSVDAEGRISSTSLMDRTITWATLPYRAAFELMPNYNAPLGWDVLSGGDFRLESDYTMSLRCNQQASGMDHAINTPWIYLGEGKTRVVMRYNMQVPGRWGMAGSAYNDWDENELLALCVTADEVTYDTIYTARSTDHLPQEAVGDYNTVSAVFDKYAGQKVKVQFFWRNYKQVNIFVSRFVVEEKPACDYPVGLTAGNINADAATLSWTSQGDENMWEIRYRAGEGEWSAPIEVLENPCTITGLPGLSLITWQVRAKCSMESVGPWSEEASFMSGYSVPYEETFQNGLSDAWEMKVGTLATPTVFDAEGVPQFQWISSWMSRGLLLYGTNQPANDWLLTPAVNLGDGSVNYNFSITLMTAYLPETGEDEYKIVVSKDGGATFNEEDVVLTFTKADMPEEYEEKTFTASLKGLKGMVRPALYVKSTAEAVSLQVMGVSITPTCPTDVVAETSDIDIDRATVTWTGTKDDDQQWLVFFRQAGSTEKTFTAQAEAKLELTGLTPRTAYEVGITKACAEGDTAKVVIAAFTTASLAPCAQPTAIQATATKTSIQLTWEGEAMKYNVRFRQAGAEEWSVRETQETQMEIIGLTPGVSYEYGIQSVCSEFDGDVSEYTATATISTLPITCFAPTNIQVAPTHKAAAVTWEGEADNYELAYRRGTEEWSILPVSGKSAVVEPLDPTTKYSVRLRSVCSADDVSDWSEAVEFTTLAIPECVAPTNLTVSDLTEDAAKLSWTADESNLAWDLRYREGAVTEWTTVSELAETSYALTGLKPETAYIWTVKAACDEGRTSAWASQGKFTTTVSGISSYEVNGVNVYVAGNVLNIANEAHCWIQSIEIVTMDGKVIYAGEVNTDENVFIPMNLKGAKLLVKVNGKLNSKTYPIVF